MKALLLSQYRHLELTDLPYAGARARRSLVRVAACGICGSDVHGYDGSSGRRIPPIIMGHEAAGIIAADRRRRDAASPKAIASPSTRPSIADNAPNCLRGDDQSLRPSTGSGRLLWRLPPRRSIRRVCRGSGPHRSSPPGHPAVSTKPRCSRPLRSRSTRFRWFRSARSTGFSGRRRHDRTSCCSRLLRVAGCSRVFVADVGSDPSEFSQELGATATFSGWTRPHSQVMAVTGGAGMDLVIEAVGIQTQP